MNLSRAVGWPVSLVMNPQVLALVFVTAVILINWAIPVIGHWLYPPPSRKLNRRAERRSHSFSSPAVGKRSRDHLAAMARMMAFNARPLSGSGI